jgi:hypothetical protein
MVKILNITGDIKIGTQGPAVYQRKHGVQIRRMRQPKRAIASEKQIEHRQLYTSALAWRKSLTLPQRRFLDGYAISHWIVDDHKQPLPWHRLALKLYLEHIKFIVTYKAPPTPPDPYGMQDNHSLAPTGTSAIYTNVKYGQTFTPSKDYLVDRLDVPLYRTNNPPGPCVFSIYLADASHFPTGSPLAQDSKTTYQIALSPGAAYTFTFTPVLLTKDVEYIIVGSTSGGTSSTTYRWRYREASPNYDNGIYCNTDTPGTTWYTYEPRDHIFALYGQPVSPVATTQIIAVRHPAIKDITHSRNATIIQKWENLSSFTEERLFDYQELTVDVGDMITATTLAGISKEYRPF